MDSQLPYKNQAAHTGRILSLLEKIMTGIRKNGKSSQSMKRDKSLKYMDHKR